MRAHSALCAAALALAACSTRPPDARCNGDLNCPTAFFCGAQGICEALPANFAVTPEAAQVAVSAGDTVKLKVTNTGGVVWSLLEGQAAGSIEQDGTYHAPVAAGTFHAVATSTADPSRSAQIALSVSFLAPVQPVISSASPVTAGQGGLTASVDARSGMTYAWTISGGTITSAASGVTAGGKNSITFTAGAVGAISLTCVETNAGNVSSAQGVKGLQAVAAPATPTIVAATPVFTGATGRTAAVTARTGYTYKWTLSGGTLLSADTGVTDAGQNTVTWTAGAVGTATFTCIETNAAGTASAPAAAQVSIVPASPITSASPVTAGAASSASLPVQGGHTYSWAITGGTLTGVGAAGTSSGGKNTVTFTAGAAGTLHLACTESGSGTVFSLDVQVVAAPTIASFSAAPSVLQTGQTTQLTAVFANGTGVIDRGLGAVTSGTAVTSAPITTQLTVFTLTVTNGAGTAATQAVTVTITNGTFSSAGALATARAGASATRLANGQVLFAGGTGASGTLATAELYDGTSFTAIAAPLTAARAGHTATLLPDGRVLLAGGADGAGPLDSAELYDPATKTFTATATAMKSARAGHTATLLPTGLVLLAGGAGSGGVTASADLFDPATGSFTATGPLQTARRDACALLLWTGEVLIAGGKGPSDYLGSAELYRSGSGDFAATSSGLSAPRARAACATLGNGQALLAGGEDAAATSGILASADRYDPVAKTFTGTGPLAKARRGHALVRLGTGKVLAVGGEGATGDLDTLESYDDQAAGAFAQLPGALAPARHDAALALLGDGRVLVAGGSGGGVPIGSAVLYDPNEQNPGTWTVHSQSLSATRQGHTATLLGDGRVLLAHGGNGVARPSLAEIFDPRTGAVTAAGGTSSPRGGTYAVRLGDGRVLLGGGNVTTADLFDPRTNTFTRTGDMTVPRSGAAAVLLPNGKALVVGGYDSQGLAKSSAELFDPGTGTFTAVAGTLGGTFYDSLTLFPLPTGRALLFGSQVLATGSSAFLFDAASATFTSTGSLPSSRLWSTTPVLLPDGRLLLASGYNGEIDRTTSYVYDTFAGTFSTTGSMTTARSSGSSGVLLPDGRALIAGGDDTTNIVRTAELYWKGTFSATGSLSVERKAPLVLLPDGRAAMFGGSNDYGTLATIEIYR